MRKNRHQCIFRNFIIDIYFTIIKDMGVIVRLKKEKRKTIKEKDT